MSADNQDESIASSATSTEQTEGQTAQAQQDVGQPETTNESDLIPEKFIGKSVADVAQAYRELEKNTGRLRSELGETRKVREELEAKYRELETRSMRYQNMPTQAPPPHQAPQVETDPFATFDSRFEEDPKTAIKEALRLQQEMLSRQTQNQSIQQRQHEASEWYHRQKKDNQDYARREPVMQQVAQQYADIIKPEYLNSVKALQLLDEASRGRDVGYYEKSAVEAAKKGGLSAREEKRRAQSESSSSEGEQTKSFKSLSIKEMEDYLRRSEE